MDQYGIAAFRSRQAVLRFDEALRRAGIETQVVTTPRAVSMGCGLSVRFDAQALPGALAVYQSHPLPNLIGFYTARESDGRIQVTRARL